MPALDENTFDVGSLRGTGAPDDVRILGQRGHGLRDIDENLFAGYHGNIHPVQTRSCAYSDKLAHLHLHLVPKYPDGPGWGTTFTMTPDPKKLLSGEESTGLIAKIKAGLR